MKLYRRDFIQGAAATSIAMQPPGAQAATSAPCPLAEPPTTPDNRIVSIDMRHYFATGWTLTLATAAGLHQSRHAGRLVPVDGEAVATAIAVRDGLAAIVSPAALLRARMAHPGLRAVWALPTPLNSNVPPVFVATSSQVLNDPIQFRRLQRTVIASEVGAAFARRTSDAAHILLQRIAPFSNVPEAAALEAIAKPCRRSAWDRACRTAVATDPALSRAAIGAFELLSLRIDQRIAMLFPRTARPKI